MSVPAAASAAVQMARDAAARTTGIRADAWRLVEVLAVNWPDASLGCPQPGQVYAQVITPGFLIRLESAGRKLEYHAGEGRVVACDSGPPAGS